MAIKNPKTLVIDASVAGSSGDNLLKEKAIFCSEFLNEILNLGHLVIFTRELRLEWEKHQSNFAISWYQKMLIKKRIVIKKIENDDLRQAILEIIRADDKAAVAKDLHLIEAAKLADDIIASMDDKMRNHLKRAAIKIDELKIVVWINPTIEEEKCIIWLREGALSEETRCLGYQEETE